MELLKDFKVIFDCIAGSHLYGTATEQSDKDTRGVFIPSREYFLGFVHRIEQIESKEPDVVHYDIRKFFNLCLQCNPNIVELLFVPENKMNVCTEEWEQITDNKDIFLSKKARYTFAGYAVSQLHRIKQHRNWLLNPPKKQPERSDFGLPNDRKLITKEQLNAYDALLERDIEMELDLKTMQILGREKAFQNANREWGQYLSWKQSRNPERAKLEEKFGFDTKHGSHLYRLMMEGKELLLTGSITLPRPDAETITDIRNGKYSYDELMEIVGDIDTRFDDFYEKSILPHKPNAQKADELCVNLVTQYLQTMKQIIKI
jgi:uncharacterized protein